MYGMCNFSKQWDVLKEQKRKKKWVEWFSKNNMQKNRNGEIMEQMWKNNITAILFSLTKKGEPCSCWVVTLLVFCDEWSK